ncbi:hypothetical protein MYK68_18185 [Gordonia sp. PP30]|uniref:hypothetical protein n=1 Tax=Gordonia sp. PP30 TaxID=2935861 RepID=UPI001FFF26F3|nr:hypothetical protein [Gordonia sp. PP30]UQE74619.1 hypothetical protein MYK68_18185 [Gordonia sp. PP30]
MAQEPDPDSRPITVDELIARTSDEAAFPRAGSPSVHRDHPADDAAAPTASGMPGYTPPAKTPTARVVGASGMPAYVPAPSTQVGGESANVVTGIIPVVSGDEDDFAPIDTGSLRAVERDDLLGEDLPTGEQPVVTTTAAFAYDDETGTASDTETVATIVADEDADHLASPSELAAAQRADDDAVEAAGDTGEHRRSPVWGWLGLIGEVILGLAIGAGLFWGFTVLWREYVYFALVLAVLVIFAIVTFAYVLRKRDLPTTLLALAVGLIVTIGPLVLLV